VGPGSINLQPLTGLGTWLEVLALVECALIRRDLSLIRDLTLEIRSVDTAPA
jgi:hypothetical protein